MSSNGSDSSPTVSDGPPTPPSEPAAGAKPREPMLGRGLACQRCRLRKQKCDGEQPACRPCVRTQNACQYIIPTKVSKPRPHATAVEGLTAKLARLEEQYANLAAARRHPTTSTTGSSSSPGATSFNSWTSTSPGYEHDPSSLLDCTFDPLLTAFRAEDMPPQDRDVVIRIFFTGAQRLGCPILPHRFFQRLSNPDPKQQPHPALINAMLLVGVAFTWWTPGYSTATAPDLPPTTPSAETLLAKTQAYLTESLSNVDRLLDHLQASILLSYYFFQQGRLQEGQFVSASNSRMAVTCCLHQIDQSVLDEMKPGRPPVPQGESMWDHSLLGRPADGYELGIRIWTFWQSWYYDSVFGIISGTEVVRDPVKPTTVFPRRSHAYESGIAFSLHHHSFDELFKSDPPELIKPVNEPPSVTHPLASYLKGIAILDRTNEIFASLQKQGTVDASTYTSQIQKLHNSLQILASEHLPILDENLLATHQLTAQEACQLYCPLSERVVGHVLLYTATIQVCRVARSLPYNGGEVERSMTLEAIRVIESNAARDAVKTLRIFSEEVKKLSRRMQGSDTGLSVKSVAEVQEHPCLLLSFLLTTVCLVLIDHIRWLRLNPSPVTIMELIETENDLALALSSMEHTAKSFPLLRIQVQKIHDYRNATDLRYFALDDSHFMWEWERRANTIVGAF